MSSFGETLKAAREAKGLTCSQVAAQTHMLVQIVEEMEREDFHRIPAPIYGRGFVRLFADCVGLDPIPLVREFMDIYEGRRAPAVSIREVPTAPVPPPPAPPTWQNAVTPEPVSVEPAPEPEPVAPPVVEPDPEPVVPPEPEPEPEPVAPPEPEPEPEPVARSQSQSPSRSQSPLRRQNRSPFRNHSKWYGVLTSSSMSRHGHSQMTSLCLAPFQRLHNNLHRDVNRRQLTRTLHLI